MGKKIGIGIMLVVLLLAIVVATRPDTFKVERSTEIAAPSAIVFAQLNSFDKWNAWSPWDKKDPAMTRKFEGPLFGVGAKYSWAGNGEVGEGSMLITESRPDELVAIRLEFLKPFAATNDVTFTLAPVAQGTHVTWAMSGKNNFMSKAFSMVMDMDKMVGGDFEKGLDKLKEVSENENRKLIAEKVSESAAAAAATTSTAPVTDAAEKMAKAKSKAGK